MHCKLQGVQMVERLQLGCQVQHARHRLWVWLGWHGNLEDVQVVQCLPLACQVPHDRHRLRGWQLRSTWGWEAEREVGWRWGRWGSPRWWLRRTAEEKQAQEVEMLAGSVSERKEQGPKPQGGRGRQR